MRQTRLDTARTTIIEYFESLPVSIFTPSQIDTIVKLERSRWRLAQRTTTSEIIRLLSAVKLQTFTFRFPSREDTRYVWGTVPALEVAVSLRPSAFISHFTAMKAHGLTDKLPKTIYINQEQSARSDPDAKLRQHGIDAAFARPQRLSNTVADWGDYRICILRGQDTGRTGVVRERVPDVYTGLNALVPITNLERTLIDIAVRPAYSGGVADVLGAYEAARGRASVNRLVALLKEIEYVYPYHQAIGFFLERAGYNQTAISLIREIPIRYDFYLTHEMREPDYDDKWRLYIPKGL